MASIILAASVVGVSAITDYRPSPKVAITHVVTGFAPILASLVTDYRAYRGVGRRSRVAMR